MAAHSGMAFRAFKKICSVLSLSRRHERRALCSAATKLNVKPTDEIDRVRDISGLRPSLKKRLAKEVPDEPSLDKTPWLDTARWRRRMYGAYGSSSGIDPSLCWPTEEQLQELVSNSREWEPSLQDMLSQLEATKKADNEFMRKRMALIDQRMKKMPQFVEEYESRKAKRELEVKKREEKQQKLLDEAREFYGYKIDVRDAKFKAMVEEKAAREEEERKKQKKLQRQGKLLGAAAPPLGTVPSVGTVPSSAAAQPSAGGAQSAPSSDAAPSLGAASAASKPAATPPPAKKGAAAAADKKKPAGKK